MKKLNNKGFSLVELIIVIAIMAILVGVVGSQVIPYLENSRKAKDLQVISAWNTAAMSAYSNAAAKVNAALLIAPTSSGGTARLLAKYRPDQVISALSNNKRTLQRMTLYRGVRPIFCNESTDISMPLDGCLRKLQQENNIPNGAAAVITNGLTQKSGTSIMEIMYLNYN